MSIYPAPTRYPSIFNPADFSSFSNDSYLSTADANSTYAKLAGGQTIVAQETFSGGIKTNSIVPATGTGITITGNSSQTGNMTITGNMTQNSGYSTNLQTTTVTGTMQATRIVAGGTTAENSFAGNTTFNANVGFGSPFIKGSSWTASIFTSGNYSLTITSSALPFLSQTNFQGQLCVFARNGSTNSGMLNFYLIKRNGGTIATTASSTPPTNFTTLSLSATSNTIVVSTGTTASDISCLFIGAY